MKIKPFGDSALIITFERVISETTNQQVISLYNALKSKQGITYLIPAYNSLTVGIALGNWNVSTASVSIQQIFDQLPKSESIVVDKTYTIPVCYEKPYDLDSEDVCQQTNLSKEELIEIHTSHTFRVYMLGFVAGFAYMGSLPSQVACKRKPTPRLRVPKGSVGLAGLQTGIYPTEAPGGWQIIGQTPLQMFDGNRSETSLLKPGDHVKFRAIGLDEFKIIQLKIETDIFEMEEAHV